MLGGTSGSVAILFSSFPRAPCTPPSGQPSQGKEVILYRKVLNETPEGQLEFLGWSEGILCTFSNDLKVLSDESFVMILSISSF